MNLDDIRRSAPGRKLGRDDNENRRKDYDVDILDEQISDVDEDMSEGGNNSGMENEEHYFDRTKLETRIKENAPPTDFLHNFPRESHQRRIYIFRVLFFILIRNELCCLIKIHFNY